MRSIAFLVALVSACVCACGQDIAVRARVVYTMAGSPIEDGVVVVRGGKIAAVGPAGGVEIPEGVRVLQASVATPGLVDARSTVGLSGIYNVEHDQDQLERSRPIQPELRALDAYNAREPLVEYLRSFGVTTVHTGHAPGELVSGQTIVVKTVGNTVEEALLKSPAAVVATLSPAAQKGGGKSPGTRGKMVSMLRQELIRAREYMEKRDRAEDETEADDADADDSGGEIDEPRSKGGVDLKKEALAGVLRGEVPLMVTANRVQDIASALRLRDEFGFKLILDMGAEAYLMADELAEAGVPVIVHPTMYRATGETQNLTFENAARLADAGVTVAMQSGYESYVPKTRVVLFEAAMAAANGLGFERALRSCTIDAAELIGVGDRVGSLEVGKDGDIALYDGDPFEYATHCVKVVIDGVVVSERVR